MFEPFDFIRFRLTRSRDMRAATYRELFLNQATLPDQAQWPQLVARAYGNHRREPERALRIRACRQCQSLAGEQRHDDCWHGAVAGWLGAGHAPVG